MESQTLAIPAGVTECRMLGLLHFIFFLFHSTHICIIMKSKSVSFYHSGNRTSLVHSWVSSVNLKILPPQSWVWTWLYWGFWSHWGGFTTGQNVWTHSHKEAHFEIEHKILCLLLPPFPLVLFLHRPPTCYYPLLFLPPPISGLWPRSPTYLSLGRAISFSLFPIFWKLIFLGANGAGKCFVKRMYALPHREKCKETEILAISWARVCGLVPVVPLGHTRCVWGLVIERYFRITFPKLFWKTYGHYSKEHSWLQNSWCKYINIGMHIFIHLCIYVYIYFTWNNAFVEKAMF